ncbi:LOW QUALITY PROTEIN: hypothetical protein MAR_001119, partial [Mya arenaria]
MFIKSYCWDYGNAESQSALSPTIVATVKDPMALHATLQPKSENNFKLPTPVLINTLALYLDGYDTDKTHFLVKGFNQGFSLGTADYIPLQVSQNHSSVHKNLDFVRNKLATEVTRGRIKGPYITTTSTKSCIPLGAVPKRTKNSFRLIHDLSFSSSTAMPSVNSLIPKYNSVIPTVTLKQLQSLLGHLNLVCKVIKMGRCFLGRRFYDLTIGCKKPNHPIRLASKTRADIPIWHTFLNDYNGWDRFTTSTTLKLFTDAAGSKGFACTHRSSWTFGIFPQKVMLALSQELVKFLHQFYSLAQFLIHIEWKKFSVTKVNLKAENTGSNRRIRFKAEQYPFSLKWYSDEHSSDKNDQENAPHG